MRRPAPHLWILLFALPGYASRDGNSMMGNVVLQPRVMGKYRPPRGDGVASPYYVCLRGLPPLNVKSTTDGASIAQGRTWVASCPDAMEGEAHGSMVESSRGGALQRGCTTRDHPATALRAPPRIAKTGSHPPDPDRVSVEDTQRAGSSVLRLRGAGEQSEPPGEDDLGGSGETPHLERTEGGGGDGHVQPVIDEKLHWKRWLPRGT